MSSLKPRSLGKLIVEVIQNPDGSVIVTRTTELSPELGNMQLGMSDSELLFAMDLRTKACAGVADFFLFVSNPDNVRLTQ
jgi:hypothetical protein